MRPNMIGRTLVLAIALSGCRLVYAQCAGADPEALKALTEIHTAQLLDVRQTEVVVNGWLPQIIQHIQEAAPDRDWYHLAIIVVRELDRYGRRDEAREILELVAKGQPKVAGRMRMVALKALAERDRAESR
jgi:rhodanese-related sulfurtransferase